MVAASSCGSKLSGRTTLECCQVAGVHVLPPVALPRATRNFLCRHQARSEIATEPRAPRASRPPSRHQQTTPSGTLCRPPRPTDRPVPPGTWVRRTLTLQPQWRAAPSPYGVFELSLTAGRHPPRTATPASRRTSQRCHGSPVLPTVKIQLNNHSAHNNHHAMSPRPHAPRRGYPAR
jgi:hypothetical protein